MYLRPVLLIVVALSSSALAQETKSREQSAVQSLPQSLDETVMNEARGAFGM